MIVEKSFPSGAWVISETHDGYLTTRRYYGYTKKEAMACFREELKGKKS